MVNSEDSKNQGEAVSPVDSDVETAEGPLGDFLRDQPREESPQETIDLSGDATSPKGAIVRSLLDNLVASAPDSEFTEAVTAVPVVAVAKAVGSTGNQSTGNQSTDNQSTDNQSTGNQRKASGDHEGGDSADITKVTDKHSSDDADLLTENAESTELNEDDSAESTDGPGSEDPTIVFNGTDRRRPMPEVEPTDAGDSKTLIGSEDQSTMFGDTTLAEVEVIDDDADQVENGDINDAANRGGYGLEQSDLDETRKSGAEDLTAPLDEPHNTDTMHNTDAAHNTAAAHDNAARRPELTPSSGRRGRGVKILALAVVGPALLLVGAWGVDTAASQGRVLRGTTFAGQSIQGLSEAELEDLLAERTEQLARQPLDVKIGDVTVNSDPVTLGVGLDDEAIIGDALDAGRQDFLPLRPINWIGRFFSTEEIEERFDYDEATTTEAAETILVAPLEQVKEPELVTTRDGDLTVEPGAVGTVIDASELIDRLPPTIEGGAPYTIELSAIDDSPSLTDEQVQAVADDINAATSEAVALRVLDSVSVVETDQLREWARLDENGGEASWSLDADLTSNQLQPLFPSLGSDDQQAKFVVVDEEPRIIPASETVICCEEDSVDRIRQGLDDQPLALTEEELDEDDPAAGLRTIDLDPITVGADEGVAELESLGIIEEVSSFTTEHACCQNRVTNIQRFADLMQGVIIRPGETISLNGHVGQRTREKGFVADGAINLGVLEPQVGGGISQYATTFFNASFFAGLEFIEYQSHSLYISRYPRGREATISWRRPDLKVKNTTPYGVLVWNSYTPNSITVSFYSTKHLEVEALPLRRSSERQCRVDITPRLITFPDGTQTEDSVFALYRPGEGLDCNGDSTQPEKDEPTPAGPSTTISTEEVAPTTTAPGGDDDGIDDAVTTAPVTTVPPAPTEPSVTVPPTTAAPTPDA